MLPQVLRDIDLALLRVAASPLRLVSEPYRISPDVAAGSATYRVLASRQQ